MPTRLSLLDKVEALWEGCCACPLHASRTRIVHWRGSPDARLLIVGEGPGHDEDVSGRPFVGKAGRKLDELLTEAGLDPVEDVFIINVVGCRPPSNRVPDPAEIRACRTRVEQLVNVSKPKAMLLLGATASKALAGIGQISQWRGRAVDVEVMLVNGRIAQYKAVPTFHPSYLLRSGSDPKLAATIIDDIKLAKRMAQ